MEKEVLKNMVKGRYESAKKGEAFPATLILEKELAPKIFTPKRVELLEAILKEEPSSVTELAEKTGRARENVTRDLNYLEGLNLVSYRKEKGKKVPRVNTEMILIPLKTTRLLDYLKGEEKAKA
jgi:predicted transcriptional regulator